MKKLLIVLGAVFLCVIILAAIGIAFIAVKGESLDKESKAYVDRNLPLILSAWDEQALQSQASPEFTEATSQDHLDKYFTALSKKFGKMQSYQSCTGQSYMDISPKNGKVVTAVYTAKVSFDGGPAAVKLTLIRHADRWQIAGFDLTSDRLIVH